MIPRYVEDPPAEATLSPGSLQRTGLFNRIDVRRSLEEYAAAESAVRSEIARQYPDISFGPGFAYDQGQNKFTFGFSVTLPIFNRNKGPIAEAEARREEVATRFLSLQARVIGETDQSASMTS